MASNRSQQQLQPLILQQDPLSYRPLTKGDCIIDVIQQPKRSVVDSPIEPPPFVKLIQEADKIHFQSPYLFVVARLVDASTLKPANKCDSGLSGSNCSSLHCFSVSGEECNAFVFGELIAKTPGNYRLCFTLFDGRHEGPARTVHLAQTYSDSFEVVPAFVEPTNLSRSFYEQGGRLRLPKKPTDDEKRKRKLKESSDVDGALNKCDQGPSRKRKRKEEAFISRPNAPEVPGDSNGSYSTINEDEKRQLERINWEVGAAWLAYQESKLGWAVDGKTSNFS